MISCTYDWPSGEDVVITPIVLKYYRTLQVTDLNVAGIIFHLSMLFILIQEEMDMDTAQQLFKTLAQFKQSSGSDKTSQERLIEYCKHVLGAIEGLHVDFKEKHDGTNSQLAIDDQKNLAKAVSGFSNSGGGVLIWGLENRTLSPKPICDIQGFVSSVLQLAPQLTDPTVPGIEGDWLAADNNDSNEGFGLIYIPESSLPPHRVLLNDSKIKNHYYFRSGEDFVVASHIQLEDMFGRRPKPVLSLSKRFLPRCNSTFPNLAGDITVILGIENTGRGSARAPLLAIEISEPYKIDKYGIDGNYHFGLPQLTKTSDVRETTFGSSTNTIIHSGIVHEVAQVIVDVTMDMSQGKVAIPDLIIDYKIVAEGLQLIQEQDTVSRSFLYSELEKSAAYSNKTLQ